jgi:hypothetical protein
MKTKAQLEKELQDIEKKIRRYLNESSIDQIIELSNTYPVKGQRIYEEMCTDVINNKKIESIKLWDN